MKTKKTKQKTFGYKGYNVAKKYNQWYSYMFQGSFSTLEEFKRYIDGRIGRGNLQNKEL